MLLRRTTMRRMAWAALAVIGALVFLAGLRVAFAAGEEDDLESARAKAVEQAKTQSFLEHLKSRGRDFYCRTWSFYVTSGVVFEQMGAPTAVKFVSTAEVDAAKKAQAKVDVILVDDLGMDEPSRVWLVNAIATGVYWWRTDGKDQIPPPATKTVYDYFLKECQDDPRL